jgi:peptidoglycan/xylan/chitin deacetylase (PgdA/CDA1 family)
MMGIIANPAEDSVVREFFELFKTPWEYVRRDRQYDVVLCAENLNLDLVSPKLLIVYGSRKTSFDEHSRADVLSTRQRSTTIYAGTRLPLLGSNLSFHHQGTEVLRDANSAECIAYVDRSGAQTFVRIGYDLFREVHALLTQGQCTLNATSATLDLHIAFLRDLIVGCGIPLVEVPPLPDGYPFIACLTHDVDHPFIRTHKLDPTMLGFLYRAMIGSIINLSRGRMTPRKVLRNWVAALKLPFVYFGLAKDFWNDFQNYVAIERGHPSTFFFIPFRGIAGRTTTGTAPRLRACRYELSQLASHVSELRAAGCEIGLHGIDAWIDSFRGREEAEKISELSGIKHIGVRMHWLYMNTDSPALLDEVGFLYDSTSGYSETVGYRAGTSQIFKPLQAKKLLELPMQIMDTALFYPARLNLSETQAWNRLGPVLDHVVYHGGVLTINWHDRSIAPERLWGDFYARLLDSLQDRGPWFATATQAVHWFLRRRSVKFDWPQRKGEPAHIRILLSPDQNLPPMRLRIHRPQHLQSNKLVFSKEYESVDLCLNRDVEFGLDELGELKL